MTRHADENPRFRVVLAIPDLRTRQKIQTALQMSAEFALVSTALSLSDAFADIEGLSPNLVMIDAELASSPEFRVMRDLFGQRELQWILVGEAQSVAATQSAVTIGQGESPSAIRAQLAALFPSVKKDTSARSLPHASRSLVLIGASTGGVEALGKVLTNFPADCPPTVVVQHTSRGFGANLVDLLNKRCLPKVVLATNDQPLAPGVITVAAGLPMHVELAPKGPARLQMRDPRGETHIPSVDRLFHSAVPRARRVVAALLTGMGRDGASGLLALRQAGATTFAQDSATSVVDGMPRAARNLGAVSRSVPLGKMSAALLQACEANIPKEQNTHA